MKTFWLNFLFFSIFILSSNAIKTNKDSYSTQLSEFEKYAKMSENLYNIHDNYYDKKIWSYVGIAYNEEYDAKGKVYTSIQKNKSEKKTILFVFRGTEEKNVKNIATDIDIKLIDYPLCKNCKVHQGMYKHFKSLRNKMDDLLKSLKPDCEKNKIVLTGHSLGGVTAIYMTNYILDKYPKLKMCTSLYTFGSSKPGNKDFSLYTTNLICDSNIYRVVYRNDCIPSLPTRNLGYEQIGNKIYHFLNNSDYEVKTEVKADVTKGCGDHSRYININS